MDRDASNGFKRLALVMGLSIAGSVLAWSGIPTMGFYLVLSWFPIPDSAEPKVEYGALAILAGLLTGAFVRLIGWMIAGFRGST